MLARDRVISPREGVVGVAWYRVDPYELSTMLTRGRASGYRCLMGATRLSDGGKVRHCIGTHFDTGRQGRAGPRVDFTAANPSHPMHAHRPRLNARRIGGRSRHEWRVCARAATALVAAARPAPVGVVHLGDAFESPTLLAFRDRLHELVLHEASTVVAESHLPNEDRRRYPVLRVGQKTDRQHALIQRQLGGAKQGPRGERGLVVAAVPLVAAAPQQTVARIPALRTHRAFGLAPCKQRLVMLRISSVACQKVVQTHAPVKSPAVLGHRVSAFTWRQAKGVCFGKCGHNRCSAARYLSPR